MSSDAAPAKPATEYLFDFVYLDRPRLSSYLAQMVTDGVLTTVKRNDQTAEGIKTAQKVGLPVYKVDNTDEATVSNSLERMFDASWSAVVDTLHLLHENGFVDDAVTDAQMGRIVLVKGALEVLDLRILRELWPAIGKTIGNSAQGSNKEKAAAKQEADMIATIISKLPHSIQMSLRAAEYGEVWSTLDVQHMTISTDDLAFKHGAQIAGKWHVMGLLDARPNSAPCVNFTPGNQIRQGMLQVLGAVQEMLGRPAHAYGVTPLAVFRPVKKHQDAS